VSAAELAILEPFYRSALIRPGTLEYHSAAPVSTSTSPRCRSPTPTATSITPRHRHRRHAGQAAEEALREAEDGPDGSGRTSGCAASLRGSSRQLALCELDRYSADAGADHGHAITPPDDAIM
jgi:hypothetical protein